MSRIDAFKVVVNNEEQYSIWPAGRPTPAGWREEGTSGDRDECLQHIETIWVDMRPLSVRRRLADAQAGRVTSR